MRRLAFLYISAALLLLTAFPESASAQKAAAFFPGELIVQLVPGHSISAIQDREMVVNGEKFEIKLNKTLSQTLNIHLVSFPEYIPARLVLSEIRDWDEILIAQVNHQLSPRTTFPNDSFFNVQQWSLNNTGQFGGTPDADIDAPEAWDVTTGGLTAQGDTIVIAVIDGGFDLYHPDLHFFKNRLDIPGNGWDDDGNGYVDDFDGWNSITSTGEVHTTGATANHGTHVAGIAAARGNNAIGISGVNWNAQVMPIKSSDNVESEVVEAYAYALDMRRAYNNSGGSAGAFVVVTNASFGVDEADPADFPLWCGMYDSLGAAGVLSAGATMNLNLDVDVTGDVPTACASDYLVAVTNTTNNDSKFGGAAYGDTTIDIGAPGTSIYSTIGGGNYISFTGTSMASPHVAGAIALLFSAACPDLIADYKANPGATALLFREFLLNGADSLANLTGLVATDGRLNLYNSVQLVQNYCSAGCFPPYGLTATHLTDTSSKLNWANSVTADSFRVRWRPVGAGSWDSLAINQNSFDLDGLSGCTLYEFQVRNWCGGTLTDWSASRVFESEGCCRAPDYCRVLSTTDSTAWLTWPAVYGANPYRIRFRESGSSIWDTVLAVSDTFEVGGLLRCATYEFQVGAVCDTLFNGWSPVDSSRTKGCSSCLDEPYCTVNMVGTDEWIDRIQVDTLNNVSGPDGGYGDFTGMPLAFERSANYNVQLEPGFASIPLDEYWRIWIDFNQDGDFDDAGEMVFDAGNTSTGIVTGQIAIPLSVAIGITRMRVTMRWRDPANPCDIGEYGETEDYCVEILTTVGAKNIHSANSLEIFPNPTHGNLQVRAGEWVDAFRIMDMAGKAVLTGNPNNREFQIGLDHLPTGCYIIEVSSGEIHQYSKFVRQ